MPGLNISAVGFPFSDDTMQFKNHKKQPGIEMLFTWYYAIITFPLINYPTILK